jgi:hypothetical protein
MRACAVVVAVLISGCTLQTGGPAAPGAGAATDRFAPPEPERPRWWLLRVANVAAPTRDWDGPAPEARGGGWFCTVVGATVGVGVAVAGGGLPGLGAAASAGGGAKSVCDSLSGKPSRQVQRPPQAPDLYVGLKVAGRVYYRTPVAVDSYSADFGSTFVVPDAVIPEDGLELVLVDADQGGDEAIGVVRVSRADLAAMQGAPLRGLEGANVPLLELGVEAAADDDTPAQVLLDATRGQLVAGAVPAGAVIELRAEGRYRISPAADGEIGPIGKSGSAGHKGNWRVPPLEGALHGAAFAAVGDGDLERVFVVGKCARYTGAFGGLVVLGINDAGNLADNSGRVTFTVTVRPPSPEEWLEPDRLRGCLR